jgi:hypothetical protein
MTPEAIAAVVGIVVSLLLEYVPKFKDWYNGLPDGQQKLFAVGIGFVVVAGAFGLGCAGLIAPFWACGWAGAWSAVIAFLAYVLANQTTYALFLKKSG